MRPRSAWCRGEFQPGQRAGFAVAVSAEGDRGGYVVLQADGPVAELARFARKPDLSCYSRARAVELNASLGRTDTVQGRITPQWRTTVICGFVEDACAVCWQYPSAARAFVEVGGWVS